MEYWLESSNSHTGVSYRSERNREKTHLEGGDLLRDASWLHAEDYDVFLRALSLVAASFFRLEQMSQCSPIVAVVQSVVSKKPRAQPESADRLNT